MKRFLFVLFFILLANSSIAQMVGEQIRAIDLYGNHRYIVTDTTGRLLTSISGSNGNIVSVNSSGQMHVVTRGDASLVNSTEIPLASAGTFIGSAADILDYSIVFVSVKSDVPSAVDGLVAEQSCDGINWDIDDKFTVASSSGKIFSFPPGCRYFRVRYTNGGLPQTYFRLHTILKKGNAKPSSHRIRDNIVNDDDVEVVKSVLAGEDETGTFVNIRAIQGDTGNNLKVSLDQVEETTNSVKMIEYSHGELHEGNHFVVRNTELLAKAGTKDILIVTPNTTKWCHFILEYESNDAAVTGYFYEAVTTSSNGTIDGTRNRNRNYPDNNTTLVYNNPTIASTGILLTKRTVGSGKSSGGGARDNNEFILKQNTKYLLRITEGNIAPTNINWILDWYEHTNK